MTDVVTTITRSIPFRVTVLGFLSLLLLIPLWSLRELVGERRELRGAAAASIAAGWGGRQTLLGPVLVLELECPWTDEKGNSGVTSAGSVCQTKAWPSRPCGSPVHSVTLQK